MTHATAHTTQAPGDLYAEVRTFYARQMRLLDGGDFAGFGRTFTEGGVFRPAGGGAPLVGPEAIAAAAGGAAARFGGGQSRHWFDMLLVDVAGDGALHTSYYAVVSVTHADGSTVLEPSCVGKDVLVRDGGLLLNQSRDIRRDDHRATR
ncbi:nuclear transport factor 2 family protein [Streptomyces sp. NPDC057702]|uniref:nuclear transport factor 2 family protein n=1 Tax=unclassified Streptomyces TaxID=2593676 RepID=UPI0036C76759